MRKHKLADGNTNSYDYDVMGRLSKASYFDGKSVVYTYTLNGQRQQVQDYRGITSYSYDNRDRVKLVTPPVGAAATSVGYNYDVMGNRTWLTATLATTSTVFTTQYGYDAAYRVLAVTDSASPQPLYYEYDAVGNRAKLTLPTTSNSTVVTYTYDALNRLTGIRQGVNLQPTALAQYTYTLSASGNREQVVEARNGAPTTTRTWSYDDAYRLLTEVRQDTGFSAITTAYSYDKTGNRLRQSVTNGASPALVTNYTYNELDQLTSVISGSLTTGYSYDRRGNLLQMGSGSGATSYRWDALDRLTVITTPGGTLTYEYDAGGKRIKQVAGGVTTNYLWDEFSPYGDVLLETNASGQFGARYALAGGELLTQKRSDGTFNYYLKDGQGSVRSLLSQNGGVTDQYDYTAFGEIASRTGSTANPYQYTGQQYDALTGLYNLRARYYNPLQGRFLSRDTLPLNDENPIELNRYVYTANNPINHSDPSGYGFLDKVVSFVALCFSCVRAFLATPLGKQLALRLANFLLNQAALAVIITTEAANLLGDRMRRAGRGPTIADPVQAQHLIPQQLENTYAIQRAIADGWNIHGIDNGLWMPSDPRGPSGWVRRGGLPIHRGSHPQYTAFVRERLNNIETQAINNSWSDREIRIAVEELVETLRNTTIPGWPRNKLD